MFAKNPINFASSIHKTFAQKLMGRCLGQNGKRSRPLKLQFFSIFSLHNTCFSPHCVVSRFRIEQRLKNYRVLKKNLTNQGVSETYFIAIQQKDIPECSILISVHEFALLGKGATSLWLFPQYYTSVLSRNLSSILL